MCQIRWGGEDFILHHDRALFWPRVSVLIVADLHIGKDAAFRSHGIPVPAGSTERDLGRLANLARHFEAKRLIVLGDLLHAAAGRSPATMDAVRHWRRDHASLDITLVRGNHDLAAGDPPDEWEIRCADEPHVEEPFALCHEPRSVRGARVLAGHIHPCVHLYGSGGRSERVACFHFARRVAVLPAFGTFTGTHPVRPRKGDRVFATGPEVIELTSEPCGA